MHSVTYGANLSRASATTLSWLGHRSGSAVSPSFSLPPPSPSSAVCGLASQAHSMLVVLASWRPICDSGIVLCEDHQAMVFSYRRGQRLLLRLRPSRGHPSWWADRSQQKQHGGHPAREWPLLTGWVPGGTFDFLTFFANGLCALQ